MEHEQRVGAYLQPEEKKTFYDYAAELHVRPATLASLLIVRELRRKRLTALSKRFGAIDNGRDRITAQKDIALKKAFDRHAAEFGLRPDPAASVIFRAELHERWLRASLGTDILESG